MTNLYFVRHAKVQLIEDEKTRPLSEEGIADVQKVTELFRRINIDAIVSSPYIRAIQTIQGIADNKELSIECYDDLRERKVTNGFIDDFQTFVAHQWSNFNYKLEDGESLEEVQKRGQKVIQQLLDQYKEKDIIIGTHGTFLALQLNYYNPKYDYGFWKNMKMPDVFKLQFDGQRLLKIENIEF